MGCCASSDDDIIHGPRLKSRRHFSATNVDGVNGDFMNREQALSILDLLNKQDIIGLLDKIGTTKEARSKFTFGTAVDTNNTSFASKLFTKSGVASDEPFGVGFTCRKGLKTESANQDAYSILNVDDEFRIYGAYDGHGQKGQEVSDFVKDNLPKLIVSDKSFRTPSMSTSASVLQQCYKTMQSLIVANDATQRTPSSQGEVFAMMSGTTATVAIHDLAANMLIVSHVGDTTAVLGRYHRTTQKLEAFPLTRDHKPALPAERTRIEAAGGIVKFDGYSNHRVYAKGTHYPGLCMSRCLGDIAGQRDAGISCQPDVVVRLLEPSDFVLLLCSDGVWEFITPQEAIDIVAKFGPDQATQAANELAQEAWDRWLREEAGTIVDDITVVVSYLNAKEPL